MSYRILLPEKADVSTDATPAVAADSNTASPGGAKPHPASDSTTATDAAGARAGADSAGDSACSTAVGGGEAFCAESASKETTAAPCAGVWGGAEVRFGCVKLHAAVLEQASSQAVSSGNQFSVDPCSCSAVDVVYRCVSERSPCIECYCSVVLVCCAY